MTDTISLKIPCNTDYISIVRTTAAYIANKLAFDIENIEDIKVAVSEACNNAIQNSAEDAYFDVEYSLENGNFTAYIIDNGIGYDPSEYKEPELDKLNESGLGIFIMKSLMDEVEITANKTKGTCVKLCKYSK